MVAKKLLLNVCKRLAMSDYDKRSSAKVRLIVIWEKIFKLDSHLATFIWEGQNDIVRM